MVQSAMINAGSFLFEPIIIGLQQKINKFG